MGARATIRIIHPTSDTPIHLYTHWRGDDILEILAEGISRAETAGRLSDYSYATRIIFDTLTMCDGGETGFGICIGDEGEPADLNYDTPTLAWLPSGTVEVCYGSILVDAMDFVEMVKKSLTHS